MPLFDGIVEIAEDPIPVILGVEEDEIRLSASGTEIGEWRTGEYRLEPGGDGTFIISADGDRLTFRPARPDAFARAIGLQEAADAPAVEAPKAPDSEPNAAPPGEASTTAPPPRPLTRALFYTLAGTTALLCVWALLRIVL